MYASSNAALRYYAEGSPKSPAHTIDQLLQLGGEGDHAAIAALTRQARYVGAGLRLISAALAPERILISGDIVNAWPHIEQVIHQSFSEIALGQLQPIITPTHETEIAKLRGAAILVVQRPSVALNGGVKSRATHCPTPQ